MLRKLTNYNVVSRTWSIDLRIIETWANGVAANSAAECIHGVAVRAACGVVSASWHVGRHLHSEFHTVDSEIIVHGREKNTISRPSASAPLRRTGLLPWGGAGLGGTRRTFNKRRL